MPKTIIEFDDSPDDRAALARVMKSTDMALAIFEIQLNLKKKLTRVLDAEEATDAEYDVLEKVFNHINREFEERNINIDELIE